MKNEELRMKNWAITSPILSLVFPKAFMIGHKAFGLRKGSYNSSFFILNS